MYSVHTVRINLSVPIRIHLSCKPGKPVHARYCASRSGWSPIRRVPMIAPPCRTMVRKSAELTPRHINGREKKKKRERKQDIH